MGPGLLLLSFYVAVAGSAQGLFVLAGPLIRITLIRTEELFCIVDFSRVKHIEGTIVVDPLP